MDSFGIETEIIAVSLFEVQGETPEEKFWTLVLRDLDSDLTDLTFKFTLQITINLFCFIFHYFKNY